MRASSRPVAAALLLSLYFLAAAVRAENNFTDVGVFPVEDSAGKDLSGLAFCGGALYANSDKIDDRIFAIRIGAERAALVEQRLLPRIPPRTVNYPGKAGYLYLAHRYFGHDPLDWEDIACAGADIYLLSERKNGILKISGDNASWLPADWYAAAHRAGYLNLYNAYVEGLALVDDNRIIVAMERQPRGLLDLRRDGAGQWRVQTHALSNDRNLAFRKNSADVAALALRNGYLFTLERNASAVCRRDLQTFAADSCFSYRAVEDDPRYRFGNSEYGLGEGLAFDDENLYVVFDTNGTKRVADAGDGRALLLRMKIPAQWR